MSVYMLIAFKFVFSQKRKLRDYLREKLDL